MDGLELKGKRRAHNVEQTELAEAIGVNPHTVSRWERGDSKILKKHWNNIDNFFKDYSHDKQVICCKTCGKDISHMAVRAIYCSRKCKDKWYDRQKHESWDNWLETQALRGTRQRLVTTLNNVINYKENVRTIRCRECGKEFKTIKEDVYYCSYECISDMKQRVLELKKLKKLIIKECGECGNRFTTLHPNTLTCSKKCSKKRKNRWCKLYSSERLNDGNIVDEHIPLRRVYERDNGICYICGSECDWNDYVLTKEGHFIVGEKYPSRDHVNPIALGGMHSWKNIRLACHRCNTLKRDIPLGEYKIDMCL